MTGVSKKYVCDKCKKRCKSARGLTQHREACNPQPIIPLIEKEQKLKICIFCKNMIEFKNYKRHSRRCHKKKFFKLFLNFLNFLYKIIISFNKTNDNDNNLRFEEEKKYMIYQEKLSNCKNINETKKVNLDFKINYNNYIQKNKETYKKIIRQINEEKINEKKRIYNDLKLNYKNIENYEKINKLIDIIFIAKRSEMPGISFRQIVFDYIKENDIENKLIIKTINKKYIKNDFPTNEEIKKIDSDIAGKINDLMLTCSKYNSAYKKYYNMISDFDNGELKNQCMFCGKFSLYKFKHFKKCKIFERKFKENSYKTIYFFIKNYYGEEKINKIPEIYPNIIKKYIEIDDFKYFITNINNNILFYNDFIKKENDEKYNKDIKLIINNENDIDYIKTNKETNKKIRKRFFYMKQKKFDEILNKIIIKLEIWYNIKIDNIRKFYLKKEMKYNFNENHELNEDKIINNFIEKFKNNEKIYEENNEEESKEIEIKIKINQLENEIFDLEILYGEKDKEKDEKIEIINQEILKLKKELEEISEKNKENEINNEIIKLISKNKIEINDNNEILNEKIESESEESDDDNDDILEKKTISNLSENDNDSIIKNINEFENFRLLYHKNIFELKNKLYKKKIKKKYIIKKIK